MIAYLHRSRDEMEEIKREAREELAHWKPSGARCKRNGSAAEKAHRRAGEEFSRNAEDGSKAEVARLIGGDQGPRAAGADRKAVRAANGKACVGCARRDGRGRVETLAARRRIWECANEAPAKPVAPEELTAGHARGGERIQTGR